MHRGFIINGFQMSYYLKQLVLVIILLEELKKEQYPVYTDDARITSKVEGILILDDGRIEGGADKRGDDTAVGF